MKKLIHVNMHVIRANHKTGARDAVFTIKTYLENIKSNSIVIDGPSELVYAPEDPLKCGARAWISTQSCLIVDGRKIP
jgi:hypothetical protein